MMWEALILLHGWSEEISIFIFLLRLLWNEEEQNSSKARQDLNMVILTSSHALLFPHICIPGLPPSLKRANWTLLCCSYSVSWVTRAFQEKLKWPTWAYVQDSLLNTERKKKKMQSLSLVRLFVTPWTVACQAPPSLQEHWVGCHFLLQGICPTQESTPNLPHCRQTLEHLRHKRRHIFPE